VSFLGRLFQREKKPSRDFLVAQVVARHRAWYPAHNRGREAAAAALISWERQLQPLSENELILLIADNRARNRLLGKTWPPGKMPAPG
jgi:hypothetical protein